MKNPGYDDTPVLAHVPFRVHDGDRPAPPVVWPGAPGTPEHAGEPPSDAHVLFNGADFSRWTYLDGRPSEWDVFDGHVQVRPGTGDVVFPDPFGDGHFHVEFCSPWEVKGKSQGRGNSGIFLMGRYELQVLDCWENPTYADGTTGAFYGQHPPHVNACRKPGEWSTYDILWEGPRWEGDRLVKPPVATVLLNGVVLHYRTELLGSTRHKTLPEWEPHEPTGPLKLQDHGDLVRFRNIWHRPFNQS